jgi:deoxyribodipyrimidine photolyase-related protein
MSMHDSWAGSAPGVGLTTILISADQCTFRNSALAKTEPADAVVLMVESLAWARSMPNHKRKLVLWFAVMRHFAQDLRAAGWTVDYHAEHTDVAHALAVHIKRYQPTQLRMMHQSDWGVTEELHGVAQAAGLDTQITPAVNFISLAADFVWNYDAANRERPKAGLRFTPVLRFEPDAITVDVIAMVERRFADHPGIVDDFALAVTRRDALSELEHFCTHRLDTFGPWQDAMVTAEPNMSHSLLSASINTGLLHPLEVCERAELAYRSGAARLQSVEGFVRQVLGWREYVWRVYCKMMRAYRERNALHANVPVPEFYWSGETHMFCLHEALRAVRETAYAHHIVRLMVLGNFALLAGFDPIETNDWFWAMFIDGYDWVMVPNVIGMSLHADGGFVGTKPYCASANYINRMSDFCKHCRYDAKASASDDACPFNALYWDFIARNEGRFARNTRMAVIVRNWRNRPAPTRDAIRAKAERLRATLRRGDPL